MGMRRNLRQIAKDRLTAAGAGNVNGKMAKVVEGQKVWRRALTGATGKRALRAQMLAGEEIAERRKVAK
jgi:hypothetical protein